MKMFCIVISIYLLLLSSLPCADIEINSAAHSRGQIAANHEDHSHDKANDLCSPFCVCNCCGQQTLTHFQTVMYLLPVKFEEIKTVTPIYTSPFYSNYHGSIWQPPQLV